MWSGPTVSRSPRERHFLVFPSLERSPTFVFGLRSFAFRARDRLHMSLVPPVSTGSDPTVTAVNLPGDSAAASIRAINSCHPVVIGHGDQSIPRGLSWKTGTRFASKAPATPQTLLPSSHESLAQP